MLSRKHLSKGALAVILSSMLVVNGCWVKSQWIQTAINDLPTLIQIITSLISIAGAAQGKGQVDPAMAAQIQTVGVQVQSDLQLLQNLVNTYQAADAAAKPGLLNKIDTGLATVQTNLTGLLAAFHVNNTALQATITASLSLAMTTILAIQSLVPPPPAATAARRAISASPVKPMSSHDLKAAFNGVVNSNGYGQFAIN